MVFFKVTVVKKHIAVTQMNYMKKNLIPRKVLSMKYIKHEIYINF